MGRKLGEDCGMAFDILFDNFVRIEMDLDEIWIKFERNLDNVLIKYQQKFVKTSKNLNFDKS